MPEPVIYHIDVNSAFLSWEAAELLKQDPDAPDIRTFPAVIGGSEELRHGIVLAKSPSAKAFGVKTGEPLAHARRKCPDLKVYPPHYSLYVQRSNEFMELLRRYAPEVEAYSIDEAFCDMTGTTSLYGEPIAFAHKLKDIIREELHFTVNIGVSSNRLLAKMASDFEKPDKVHTLFPEEVPEKLWPLPVEDLFSVGKSTAGRLRSLGLGTIGDLAHANHDMIVSTFKSHGDTIWNYAHGIESSALTHETAPENKCYGNSLTISFDVTDSATAKRVLLSLCETVGARLRAAGAYISVVQVQITNNDFHQTCHQTTLPSSTNVTEKIYACACELFDAAWDHTPIRLLGVSTSKATSESYEQYNLFDMDKYEKLSKLNSAVDKIRTRYGEDAIKRACFVENDEKRDIRHMTGGMNKAKRTPKNT
ncbi:MAG: DNA polymerase IV [Roseburia sp.]|nr:DNA polymerase IV [Roseburia sp.]